MGGGCSRGPCLIRFRRTYKTKAAYIRMYTRQSIKYIVKQCNISRVRIVLVVKKSSFSSNGRIFLFYHRKTRKDDRKQHAHSTPIKSTLIHNSTYKYIYFTMPKTHRHLTSSFYKDVDEE